MSVAKTLVLLCISALLSACISYKSDTDLTSQAIANPGMLEQIELGETNTSWLMAQFGKPNAIRRPSDTAYVWQYENIARTSRKMRALPLIAVAITDERRTLYCFEVENDRVVKFWQEQLH